MKLSYFDLFKNTYFSDMQNTLHFNSNDERDKWFDNYNQQIRFESPFNFRRDRGIVRVNMLLEDLQGYNYGRFVNGYDDKTYYFYIVSMKYLNDNTTQLDIVIDVVMTYTQGNVLNELYNIEVIRQHYNKEGYALNLQVLKQNSDYLPCTGFSQKFEQRFIFDDFVYCINSSVDLGEDYGSIDKTFNSYDVFVMLQTKDIDRTYQKHFLGREDALDGFAVKDGKMKTLGKIMLLPVTAPLKVIGAFVEFLLREDAADVEFIEDNDKDNTKDDENVAQ